MEIEKRFSVRFPESVLEGIKQAAQDEDRSINYEIVWAVRVYLENWEKKKHDATLPKDQD